MEVKIKESEQCRHKYESLSAGTPLALGLQLRTRQEVLIIYFVIYGLKSR